MAKTRKRTTNLRSESATRLIRDLQTKPMPQPPRVNWDIFSGVGGALQILHDDGTEIINVAPNTITSINRETKTQLDASAHFQSLVAQGKVRVK